MKIEIGLFDVCTFSYRLIGISMGTLGRDLISHLKQDSWEKGNEIQKNARRGRSIVDGALYRWAMALVGIPV